MNTFICSTFIPGLILYTQFYSLSLLLLFYPLFQHVGTINNRYFQLIQHLCHEKFGRSSSSPIILRIRVAENSNGFPLSVGKKVHKVLFSDYPPFHFKVNFASSQVQYFKSNYSNPSSIWYNVFFGCYEIAVYKKDGWTRPFGYRLDKTLIEDDLIRILKGDWNYFSAHLYGVPLHKVAKFDSLEGVVVKHNTIVRIGAKSWHLFEVGNVHCVGPALSQHDSMQYNNSLVNYMWRCSFGVTTQRFANIKESFEQTNMCFAMYVCFTETNKGWKTYIFGGSKNDNYPNKHENNEFLGLQMNIMRELIETKHYNLGFDFE